MKNTKLLAEAIQAMIEGDLEVADKKMRQHFIEAATEINKKLEEEMEDEVDSSEEELDEDINGNPSQDFTDEIGYKLDETEEDSVEDEQPEDLHADVDSEDELSDMPADEEVPVLTPEQWGDIRGTFDELSKLFDEIQGEDSELEVDAEFEDEPEVEDEFADVNFGEDEMHESIKLKPVQEPQKTEKEGVNKKSPVASNAKSPVEGVKPVRIKDGSVDVTDDKFKNSDAETAKVEDNNNILSSGKDVMKPAKTPKNTAEKSKSVLPKQ